MVEVFENRIRQLLTEIEKGLPSIVILPRLRTLNEDLDIAHQYRFISFEDYEDLKNSLYNEIRARNQKS